MVEKSEGVLFIISNLCEGNALFLISSGLETTNAVELNYRILKWVIVITRFEWKGKEKRLKFPEYDSELTGISLLN